MAARLVLNTIIVPFEPLTSHVIFGLLVAVYVHLRSIIIIVKPLLIVVPMRLLHAQQVRAVYRLCLQHQRNYAPQTKIYRLFVRILWRGLWLDGQLFV
jgi:hypothetical protein